MSDAESRISNLKTSLLKRSMLSFVMGISTASADTSDSYDEALIAYLNDQHESAIEYLNVSAKEGYAQAKYLLGTMYLSGLGAEKDENTGFYWCKEAAEGGVIDAQFQVGLLYYLGEGTSEDEEKAMKWFSLAADAGHKDAEEVLYVMLHEDFGFGC